MGYDGPYDSTPLADLYDVALHGGVPHTELRSFLDNHLLVNDVPAAYDAVLPVYWHRIYTTNIDNLLPTVYRRIDTPRLELLAYPRSDTSERDATLRRIQAVHLNGALPCDPTNITMSVGQYAQRSGEYSPLYEQFARDYSTKPTVFVGTELNEPLFWQHVEARRRRGFRVSEHRPKSFLIAPQISAPKRSRLKGFNVVPVVATAEAFLAWLADKGQELPSRMDVLRVTMPTVVPFVEGAQHHIDAREDLLALGEAFHLVPSDSTTANDRSFYLLGASPRWEDIHQNLDAPRHVTAEIQAYVEQSLDPSQSGFSRVQAILGSAGSGKSTILRRLGLILSQTGHTVFLTNSEALPPPKTISRALAGIDTRCVLLLDNAEVALAQLPRIVSETESLSHPPIFVLATRTNVYGRRAVGLENMTAVKEWLVPDLSRDEIIGIIATLQDNNLLGKLRGMTQDARVREFEDRANKQLLVAMREATSGQGFDKIIADEFHTLSSTESKYLYLCTALATDAGYRISTKQFIACTELPPARALHLLRRNLVGIVIPMGPKDELLLLRHRLIAKYVLDEVADRGLVSDAYRRLLRVVAPGIAGLGRRSRTFGLYRELLNHRKVYHRFAANVDEARSIYDSIKGRFADSFDYWLQYGLLELEFGFLQLAENYLRQAESLHPRSDYVRNSIGHLILKKGIKAHDRTSAIQWRDEASLLLEEQMRGEDSAYPYHIYASQRLVWLRKWVHDKALRKAEIEHLLDVVRHGRDRFGRDRQLKALHAELRREYLWLAVDKA